MALVVEDGTGKADAESYVSVADADTYHDKRGNSVWAGLTTAVKEQLLRKATDYLLQMYRGRWKGCRVSSTQALDWPRYYVERKELDNFVYNAYPVYYDSDIVPTEIANATAELALRANSAALAPDMERLTRREKVGPIEVEYEPNSAPNTLYRAVGGLLRPFLRDAGPTVGLIRR